jgi:hypothetical protein
VTRINWESLLWETRGYLGIEDTDPVPVEELREQAKANGYDEREIRKALRDTDALESLGDGPDDLRVRLTEESGKRENQAEHTPEDVDPSDETPGGETDKTGSSNSLNQQDPPEDAPMLVNGWWDADFSDTENDTHLPALIEYSQWMTRGEDLPPYDRPKAPYAPWADTDGAKWGNKENRADFATAKEWADTDPRADGLAFIQLESDPFGFVDGDDVRDPETGAVHPAFIAILEHLGATYADVSTSGSGSHAYYYAPDGLPIEGKEQATFEIDTEPWGANDDPPTVEIYANKHVNITTGEHVRGTPLEVREWNTDTLRAILEANGYTDKEPISHDTDKDRADLEEYDPDVTGSEETTTEIRDILHAVDRLEPRDLPLRTRRTGTDSTGWSTWDPSYRTSESGESVHSPPEEPVFHDHKEGESFGLLGLFAAEEGITSNPWDRLEGGEWWDVVAAARDAGAPIPEYVGGKTHDTEPVAVLPESVRDLSHATTGFDWRHTARQGPDTLTLDDARERTTDAIADAYQYGDQVLVEALPGMGKSYGAIKAAARTGEPVTILTGRGRKEQYGQFKGWCEKFGLSYYQLPSFTHDCDTANGEHGQEWADTVGEWYSRGATPKEIHKNAEYELGRPLPCQAHDGQQCPYSSKWDFDPDDFDVLIGHPTHAYRENKVVSGRTVVFDEFPGAFETRLGTNLQGAVSYWLQANDGVPFDDYTDLLENRSDETRRADALLWFEEHGVEPDELSVFDDPNAHAAAPIAVFTILAADDLGNGFEYADIDGVGTGVRNRENDGISILQPPDLSYASSVVALDGTPTQDMWELSLGERLNHRAVLQDGEREEYLRDALNLNIVRTSEHVKPYNSKGHVHTESDAALLEEISDAHGEQPGVITSATAISAYEDAGVLDLVDGTRHYGNVLGSNEFKEKRVGAVIGSNHYGDDYIKKWGAYAGETVERNDGKGADLSYGGFGDKVLTHMREHDTLQAVMRFGRDGNGAVVYTHTDTLPEWVPIAGEARVTTTRSDGERAVISALEDLGTATTEAIVEHPEVSLSRQQVFTHLNRLRERGVLDREQDAEDGRRYVWKDDGLHRVNDHGEVELDPVELDELDEETVRKVARSSIYTWEFTNRDDTEELARVDSGPTGATPWDRGDAGGDRPPDPAD